MKKANNSVNLVDLKPEIISLVLELEEKLCKELTITSGYRSPEHPLERSKSTPGAHTTGLAVDIAAVGGEARYLLMKAALDLGVPRIGIDSTRNFLHLDLDITRTHPACWSY